MPNHRVCCRPRSLSGAIADERGTVTVWVALSLTLVVAMAGLAVEIAQAYTIRQRMLLALDAAGLAMGAAPAGATQTDLLAIGQTYFNVNFNRTYTNAAAVPVTATFSADMGTIDLHAHTSVPTNFLKVVGYQTIPVDASNQIKRLSKGLELAMVLDNTGSMWSNNNIQSVRTAATNLVNILFGSNTTHPNLKIGLVPYSVAVNIAPIAAQVTGTPSHPLDTGNLNTENWKGCVIERAPPNDIADVPTSTGGWWTDYWWPTAIDNNWKAAVRDKNGKITKVADINNDTNQLGNGVHGPNIGCPTPILPLTNVKQTLLDAIAAMTAWNRGGTISSAGMAWGLRMLSPEPPLSEGVAWTDTHWQKAVILMTDGDNLLFDLTGTAGVNQSDSATTSDWSAYGRIDSTFAQSVFHTKNLNTVKYQLNTKLTSVCNAMKAKNITIYTIIFTSGITEDTKSIYKNCATDPKNYYYAPTQTDLITSFTVIGRELSNLRVSR
jgi:Flp pilus assembly protein TadG